MITNQQKISIWEDVKEFLYWEHNDLYNRLQMAEIVNLTSQKVVLGLWDSNDPLLSSFLNNSDRVSMLQFAFDSVGFPIRNVEYCDLSEVENLLEEDLCESPIEEIFFNACQHRLQVIPQYEVSRYRIDFALPHQKVAIELDGHEYHKTKEQRTKDAQRERYLQKHGWQVIRFTGSEVYQDVNRCVQDVLDIIAV